MTAPVLDRTVEWMDTNYTISVPADLPFQVEAHGFDHQSEQIRDRMVHYLHAPRINAPLNQVAVLGPFDRLPRFAASTFRDWDQFGKAYASVLLPHAKVTQPISVLAAKLTGGGIDQPWDQAGSAVCLGARPHPLYSGPARGQCSSCMVAEQVI